MTRTPVVWGVHMGAHVAERPIEGGYVAIGWDRLGDVSKLPPDRDAIKKEMARVFPEKKAGAIPVDAGTIYKFLHAVQDGDYVVYPSKSDRLVNIGRFEGSYRYVEGDQDEYPNRRPVVWLGHFPRSDFSQSALHEIGSFLTLFQVKRHVGEFLAKVGGVELPGSSGVVAPMEDVEEGADDDAATVSVSRQAEETTGDFVIRRVMAELSGHEFEDFVAHLLECMGYTTRVTQKSGDGGVDVIAHMDALGFQPPIVKVQCKRTTSQTGRPDVDQLLGTLGDGEYGLFVNLGSYSRSAVELERNRAKLRLIDGDEFVTVFLENYGSLSPRYRSMIPLKQIYVPDLSA
ncbi:MAG: restriction endonuclease [Pseudomonadota bacterium]